MPTMQVTCPETAHLETIEYEDTPHGILITRCSRSVECQRMCAARLDRKHGLRPARRPETTVQLGRRAPTDELVDVLAECHGRIRRFLHLAHTLAAAPTDTPRDELAGAAAQIRRYFVEALPLHVADEEHDVAPHLADHVVAQVRADHAAHEPAVAALVEVCRAVEQHPDQLARLAGPLASAARRLTAVLEPHLAYEEAIVFPLVRALDRAQQQRIRGAMRDRRERHLGLAR